MHSITTTLLLTKTECFKSIALQYIISKNVVGLHDLKIFFLIKKIMVAFN